MKTETTRIDHATQHRSALLAERARIMGGTQDGRDILVFPGHIAVEDQAPLMHEQFVALRRHRMDAGKLKLIDAALERMANGEFGICIDCEEPISEKRLKALPWAAHCVRCQDRKERGEASETAPRLAKIA
jgi:DnaK suppressor protein